MSRASHVAHPVRRAGVPRVLAAVLAVAGLAGCGESTGSTSSVDAASVATTSIDPGATDAAAPDTASGELTVAEFCTRMDGIFDRDRHDASAPSAASPPTTLDRADALAALRATARRAPAEVRAAVTVLIDKAGEALVDLQQAPSSLHIDAGDPSRNTPESDIEELQAALGRLAEISNDPEVAAAMNQVGTFERERCAPGGSGDESTPGGTQPGDPSGPFKLGLDRPDIPENVADEVRAVLAARSIGVDRVEVSQFSHRITVAVADASSGPAACDAVGTYALDGSLPSGAVKLVSVGDGTFSEDNLYAQRGDNESACRTTGFTYEFASDYLRAEHAGAAWLDKVAGAGTSGTDDEVTASVSITDDATDADALDICRAAAPYVFSPRSGQRAVKLEIDRGSTSTAVVTATSATDCSVASGG